jgi:ribosomal protein S21
MPTSAVAAAADRAASPSTGTASSFATATARSIAVAAEHAPLRRRSGVAQFARQLEPERVGTRAAAALDGAVGAVPEPAAAVRAAVGAGRRGGETRGRARVDPAAHERNQHGAVGGGFVGDGSVKVRGEAAEARFGIEVVALQAPERRLGLGVARDGRRRGGDVDAARRWLLRLRRFDREQYRKRGATKKSREHHHSDRPTEDTKKGSSRAGSLSSSSSSKEARDLGGCE